MSLAAERVPLPVGIGEGGGAGRFSSLVHRVIGMAVYGQNERMNEEEEERMRRRQGGGLSWFC